jgi:hypothetical protein
MSTPAREMLGWCDLLECDELTSKECPLRRILDLSDAIRLRGIDISEKPGYVIQTKTSKPNKNLT